MPEARPIRAFVAIALPVTVRDRLARVQAELKSEPALRSAAWTRKENLHLTLRFLGDVAPLRLAELRGRLREALASLPPVDLICERLGAFPDLRVPRVVWAGVHDPAEALAKLVQRVNLATADFAAQPPEARFVGHVTLLRLRLLIRADAPRLAGVLDNAATRAFGRWTCRELQLMQSEPSPSGSRYTTLDAFPLSG
jgi:RNA 2',3'-cyclic 3'-phosphodiesterase